MRLSLVLFAVLLLIPVVALAGCRGASRRAGYGRPWDRGYYQRTPVAARVPVYATYPVRPALLRRLARGR